MKFRVNQWLKNNCPIVTPLESFNKIKENIMAEVIDLRDLMNKIQEMKKMDANLALEFDCVIEVEDINPLVKVINYSINYISQLTDQQLQISLNQSMSGITLSFTAFTEKEDRPAINEQVVEALKAYQADIELKGEVGKFAQLLISFEK